MTENSRRRCQECGAVLLPKRRVCVACSAPIPGAGHDRTGALAEVVNEMHSTREPDKTVVFVPEYREARLKREHRQKLLIIATVVGCVGLMAVALLVGRMSPRKKVDVPKQQREVMAKRDLDLYTKAFEDFRADNGRYPTAQEGLGALLKRPAGVTNWHGPYIEADYSVDPWGHDYVYQSVNEARGYIMFSFGPEGESAGKYYMRITSGTPDPAASPTP
ncbi:MAG: type II secretion system protein GspG [Acidobacteria bacterium]|nr:type II secretion system protein GspG [Acidobacteriota bacterium]